MSADQDRAENFASRLGGSPDPAAQRAQEMMKRLNTGQKSVNPIGTLPGGSRSRESLHPAGLNYVDGGTREREPVEAGVPVQTGKGDA